MKLVKNEKYTVKLLKAFEKTPFAFRVVFMDLNKQTQMKNLNIDYDDWDGVDNQFADAMMNQEGVFSDPVNLGNTIIKPLPNVITVIIASNLEFNTGMVKLPHLTLTPWIVAHKIGHAIDSGLGGLREDNYSKFTTFYSGLINRYDRKELFTFKSSKADQTLENEIKVELIAQYLIQGKITLNKNAFRNDERLISIDLSKYEEKMNNLLNTIFSSMDGKILVAL